MDETQPATDPEPSPAALQARRYLEARYGKDVWYRAPETFGNMLERWVWALAGDYAELAEECIGAIERHFGKTPDA
jgi:hypothetical protein